MCLLVDLISAVWFCLGVYFACFHWICKGCLSPAGSTNCHVWNTAAAAVHSWKLAGQTAVGSANIPVQQAQLSTPPNVPLCFFDAATGSSSLL
nr:hypothetical protein Iba_chr15cCG2550 [Ipomoea batatas]GMD99239.1 hypothetical protein Iba_chr15eCG1900 [Ipomoea batatas]